MRFVVVRYYYYLAQSYCVQSVLRCNRKVRPRITKRSGRIMTAQVGYLVTRALESDAWRKRERGGEKKKKKRKKKRRGKGEVSAHRHLACIVRVSVDHRMGRARCTLCKSIVPPFLNAARYELLRSQPRFLRSRCTRQCSCNSSHDNIF